jgi:predicted kinase
MREPGRLILICGLPGAGKTTVADRLAQRLSIASYSSDDWLDQLSLPVWDEALRATIEDLQWTEIQKLLALGGSAIVEWGFWARADRDRLRLTARTLGSAVHLVYLEASLDVLMERIARRARENPPITRQMLERWATLMQAPDAEELALFDLLPQELLDD